MAFWFLKYLCYNKNGDLMKFIDLSGQKINMLTVIKRVNNKNKRVCWLCECECGNKTIVLSEHLLNSQYQKYSCGCTRKPTKKRGSKYGNYNPKILLVWYGMNKRCYYKKDKEYKHYGARNIKMCNEWLGVEGFINFQNWALENGYNDNLTIDRINNNGDYEPSNCRWVTRRENNLNRRGIIIVEYNNKRMCLKDYCNLKGLNYNTTRKKYAKNINIIK